MAIVIPAGFGSGGSGLAPGGAQGDPTLEDILNDMANEINPRTDELIFQPGGVREFNVYQDMDELFFDKAKTKGFTRITLDRTFSNPSIPAPVDTPFWDMTNTQLFASRGGAVTIVDQLWNALPEFACSRFVTWRFDVSVAVIDQSNPFYSTRATDRFLIVTQGANTFQNRGSAAWIHIPCDDFMAILMRDSTRWDGVGRGGTAFEHIELEGPEAQIEWAWQSGSSFLSPDVIRSVSPGDGIITIGQMGAIRNGQTGQRWADQSNFSGVRSFQHRDIFTPRYSPRPFEEPAATGPLPPGNEREALWPGSYMRARDLQVSESLTYDDDGGDGNSTIIGGSADFGGFQAGSTIKISGTTLNNGEFTVDRTVDPADGLQIDGVLTYNDDDTSGNSEISGADFSLYREGDLLTVSRSNLNNGTFTANADGTGTSIQLVGIVLVDETDFSRVRFDNPDLTKLLLTGAVLTDEGPVASVVDLVAFSQSLPSSAAQTAEPIKIHNFSEKVIMTLVPEAGESFDGPLTISPKNSITLIGGRSDAEKGDATAVWDRQQDPPNVFQVAAVWFDTDVAAGQGATALAIVGSANFTGRRMDRPGSIVGIATQFSETITSAADDATLTVTVGGTPGTLNVKHNSGLNADGGQAKQTAGVADTFVAGDLVGASIVTDASFTPVTTDIEVTLSVVYDD